MSGPEAVTEVAVATPRAGVIRLGDVCKTTTVPLPVVVYEVPHALPVELGMPEPGYTIPLPEAVFPKLSSDVPLLTMERKVAAGMVDPLNPLIVGVDETVIVPLP